MEIVIFSKEQFDSLISKIDEILNKVHSKNLSKNRSNVAR